ncbi:blue-light sensor BLUF [Marivirga tractuosa]|uniref:BLUF domain protein n=1 Tax=Marivirga tractuosa (strain ATCC 23168 / DSM 4126 / NBRC 15989 / NCIMB 1408 / VKM B-1430 / H-43) TaxID=643867 RepID=E4TNQ3_MARTH|nr:BLUF domain-containing protein [Marivirga tractuosa]ADR21490.1 BLUF domain protein [Marivirga tractuosa DSM 4126]BDD14056.1 blue-light sensor BLUF [Marivirga tractuosa]
MLSHLVYVSVRKKECTEEEIDKILAACKRNNPELDVTGVLLYSKTHFLQYLEGDYKEISGLYEKIKTDDRHKNVVLITTGQIKERSFPSWEMGSKEINEEKVEFQTDLSKEEAKTFQDIISGKDQEGNRSIQLIKKFFK